MENIFDRLQFVRHDEVFATREEAVDYVLSKHLVDRPALIAEPMILLYESGDETKGPNVILAIGSVGEGTASQLNRTFFIDTQKTEEEIEELREELEKAIKSLTIVPLESDTIDLHAEKTDDGTILSGDVKIADYQIVGTTVNENIITTEGNKGIFAFVDMNYDPETFVITFTNGKTTKEFQLPPDQHVEKGWYSPADEAIFLKLADGSKVKIDVVKLIDEWTVLEEASETPIMLFKEHVSSITESHDGIYDWQDLLTADVRVADHISDNIIHKDRTGRYLYVKGTADNIKYKEGVTVKQALDAIDDNVSTSTGNLIYRRPDGLYASAMLDYNSAENKLIYRYTDNQTQDFKEVSFTLNSVKILQDITYDPVREVIVIRYIDAQGEYQRVEIPAKDIIEEWIVNNEAHNIELVKYRSAGEGKDILSADAKIHNGDNNILEDKGHKLYVNGISDNIKYDVTGDTTVKDVLDTLSGETIVINGKLEAEIERAKDAEKELEDTIGTGFTSDPHDNITFKFEALSGKLDSEIERATDTETALQAAIEAEGQRAQDAETALNEKIDAETERATNAETVLEGRVDTIEEEIGDGFGPRNTIRDEFDREKAEREAADSFLSGTIETLSANTEGRLKSVTSNDNSIVVDNTDPVNPDLSVNLSAEIEDEKPNIIKLNADGLYAGVDLSYSAASNTLIFKTTNGSKTIQLDSISSIISIEYIPSLEVIRITYIANGHEVKTTDVPVGDLINEWRVEDGHPHAVQLEKVRIASGTSEQDILKASVIITDDHDDNILVMDDGSLYVSGTQISANTAAIEAEAARAQAAEDALDGRLTIAEADIDSIANSLANEIERATDAENHLQEAIVSEISRATNAENNIQNALNDEIARSTEEDQRLSDALSTETQARQDKDTELENAINSEVIRATSAETALQTAIDSEVTRATTEETRIETKLDNEITRSTAKDSSLENALNAEITRSTEQDVQLENAINSEATRATSAETALQTSLNTETARAISAETRLEHLIEDEADEREREDSILQNNIDTEIARARENENRIETALNAEINRAQTKESELNTAITNETLRAQAADNELYQKIADEIADRAAGDTTLSAAISTEISRAQVAENTISEALNSEITRSTNEDQAIRALLDSETAARQQGDAELEQMILDATLTFANTTTTKMNKSSNNVVTTDVIVPVDDNIIIVDEGIKANVKLSYNAATNTLLLEKTSVSGHTFDTVQLNAGSIIESITYDNETKELVIRYESTSEPGVQHETRVGVSDLFNPWIVSNPSEKSAVELNKAYRTGPLAEDELSARVLITDDRNGDGKPDEGSVNIIEIKNNGLFVDGSAISAATEDIECIKNEVKVFENAVLGHIIGQECGNGYVYEQHNTANYINSATSFTNADYILDQAIKDVDIRVDIVSAKTDCLDSGATKMYEMLFGVGTSMPECGEGAKYTPDAGSCVISAATSFYEADRMLGDQICEILEMWTSGITCTAESDWVDEGTNKKMLVDVRLSHGNNAEMTDDELTTINLNGDYIDPTRTEFTDTNALRIVCLEESPGGVIPDIKSKQNGIYLSNVWDCGLYYDEVEDADAIAAAQAAGYKTDNYRTDTSSSASNYNYMNNVRQNDIPRQ